MILVWGELGAKINLSRRFEERGTRLFERWDDGEIKCVQCPAMEDTFLSGFHASFSNDW